jgi:hypothetical protein
MFHTERVAVFTAIFIQNFTSFMFDKRVKLTKAVGYSVIYLPNKISGPYIRGNSKVGSLQGSYFGISDGR